MSARGGVRVERTTGSRSPASAATCVSEVDAPLPRMTALSVGAQLRQRRPRSSSERARKGLNPTAPTAPAALREERSARNSSWVGSGVRCNRYAYIWLLQFMGKSLLVQRPRAVRTPRARPRLPDGREPVHEHVDTSRAVARGSCPKAVSQRAPRSVTLTSGAIETAEHVHLSRTTQVEQGSPWRHD